MPTLLAAIVAAFGALLLAGPAAAAPKASDLVRAELVSEPGGVRAGQPFTVAVRLFMKEHWHTYWRNPGNSGLATEISWTLPPGFTAGPIQWPTPSRIPVSHLVNYGYEDETALLVEIRPPAELPAGRTVSLKANVNYLVCERECIPAEAALSTTVPVAARAEEAGPDPALRYVFDAARLAQPRPSPWPTRLAADGDKLRLSVAAAGLRPEAVSSAYFFPASETAIEHAAPQPMTVDGQGLSLLLTRSALSTGPAPTELPGVIVIEEKLDGGTARQSFQIGTMPEPSPGAAAAAPSPAPARTELTLAVVLNAALLAFLGGLILNLMPCVFPVLSIKVLSLVRHSGQSRAAIRLSGLSYTAGVVASFLLLAGLLLAIRAGGAEIGWGFQLQSPPVVAALAFLLFAMGLSLSGAVEFGTGVAARAGGVETRSGPGGSFLTGVLAAVVATPCTAPFMGAAVGFAVTAPAAVALTVFASLGLGLAAPFVLLTFWPGLAARLPRPGRWMEVLKQVLAFPLYLTVAWLVFVLSQQVGPGGLFAVLVGLVLVGFAVWCWRVSTHARGTGGRRVWQAAALASLAGLVAVGWSIVGDRGVSGPGPSATALRAASGEERFSQARLDALRQEGRPVFVNMTAAWCITCMVNERVALTGAVRAKFDEAKIVYLKGDWTNQDPEITRLLERHGRSGVPLYVFYPGAGEPVVLPQILTETMVLDGIGQVATATRRAALPSTTNLE